MIFRLFSWLFRTFTPYLLGVCIGVGFFFLLIKFASGPEGLVGVNGTLIGIDTAKVAEIIPGKAKEIFLPELLQVQDSEPVAVAKPAEPVEPAVVVAAAPAKISSPEPPAAPQPEPIAEQSASPVEFEEVSEPVFAAEDPDDHSFAGYHGKDRSTDTAITLVENIKTPSTDFQPVQCGQSPRYPGPEMNKYMACQWRNNCLASRAQTKAMLAQGRKDCVMSGRNPIACRDYFDTIEQRTSLESCNRPHAGYPIRRW
jgi:hypothetical protein